MLNQKLVQTREIWGRLTDAVEANAENTSRAQGSNVVAPDIGGNNGNAAKAIRPLGNRGEKKAIIRAEKTRLHEDRVADAALLLKLDKLVREGVVIRRVTPPGDQPLAPAENMHMRVHRAGYLHYGERCHALANSSSVI